METPVHGSRVGWWWSKVGLGGGLVGLVVALAMGLGLGLGAWVAALWGLVAASAVVGGCLGMRRRRADHSTRARWPLPAVPVALVAVTADGRVANLNRAAELVLGWAAADARGHRVEMLIPGLTLNERRGVMRTVRGAAMGSVWTCRARHRDGTSVEVRVCASLDAPGPGRVYALTEVGSRDLASVEAREERAHLIEALATELKAPLNLASASCALAMDDARRTSSDSLVRDLERIGGICSRLQALASDLVDLARLQSGAVPIRAEEVDLDPLLEAVAAQIRGIEGAAVEVEGDEAVVVRTDPERLHRILFHMVQGALPAATGRPVRVQVRSAGDVAEVEVTGEALRECGVGGELVGSLTELLGGTLGKVGKHGVRLELPLDAGWGLAHQDGDATTAPLGLADEAPDAAEVVECGRSVAS